MVNVLDINGQPLMPTVRHEKVRRLLNSHLAKVVKHRPFTIQLLYQSPKETQPASIDTNDGNERQQSKKYVSHKDKGSGPIYTTKDETKKKGGNILENGRKNGNEKD